MPGLLGGFFCFGSGFFCIVGSFFGICCGFFRIFRRFGSGFGFVFLSRSGFAFQAFQGFLAVGFLLVGRQVFHRFHACCKGFFRIFALRFGQTLQHIVKRFFVLCAGRAALGGRRRAGCGVVGRIAAAGSQGECGNQQGGKGSCFYACLSFMFD